MTAERKWAGKEKITRKLNEKNERKPERNTRRNGMNTKTIRHRMPPPKNHQSQYGCLNCALEGVAVEYPITDTVTGRLQTRKIAR